MDEKTVIEFQIKLPSNYYDNTDIAGLIDKARLGVANSFKIDVKDVWVKEILHSKNVNGENKMAES